MTTPRPTFIAISLRTALTVFEPGGDRFADLSNRLGAVSANGDGPGSSGDPLPPGPHR